jgi:hypothetical protein
MNSFRLSLVVAIGAALIIALGVFASRSLGTLNESTEFAASTQTGRFQVAHLLQTLTDMGGGVRRFEATQDIDSFQEAEAAATALPSELAELQTSFADDPA